MKILWAVGLMLAASHANAVWVYSEDSDKMTSKQTSTATIKSANSLQLDFPYKGANYGEITVRQHPSYGLDVIISIDKGQILCRSYDNCPIEIRFDEKPPIRFSGNGAADNSSNVVFVSNEQRFISAAKTAKRILVRMNIYQAGAPVLEFNTPFPLVWGKSAAPAKKGTKG